MMKCKILKDKNILRMQQQIAFFQMASEEKLFADEYLFKLDVDQKVCIVLCLFLFFFMKEILG